MPSLRDQSSLKSPTEDGVLVEKFMTFIKLKSVRNGVSLENAVHICLTKPSRDVYQLFQETDNY